VLEIDSVVAVIDWVNERPRPLGLYVFAEDEDVAERILEATNSGDACVNDCSVHPLVPELPLGGSATPGWASTTADTDSRSSPTRAACSTTARGSTRASSTRPNQ
jgi:acyl-CoA reductase-like NAD-dependent aldehyde dehydrogenase